MGWLVRGWKEEEFFAFTATTRQEHYRRYAAVIHLITTAEGAEHAYRRYPKAYRPEMPDEPIRLDYLLHPSALCAAGQRWTGLASQICRGATGAGAMVARIIWLA